MSTKSKTVTINNSIYQEEQITSSSAANILQQLVTKTIPLMSNCNDWNFEPITSYHVKKHTGLVLTKFEIDTALYRLTQEGVIVQREGSDWQYRMAENPNFYLHDSKSLMWLVHEYEYDDYYLEDIILLRMRRKGLYPAVTKIAFELFCVIKTIYNSSNLTGITANCCKMQINSETVKAETGMVFSDTEIQLFLDELIRLKMIILYPSENGRYKIAEQYLLSSEGVTTLLVMPSHCFYSRWEFLLNERIQRSACPPGEGRVISVPSFEFCFINALHFRNISYGASKKITPEQVVRYNPTCISCLNGDRIAKISQHEIDDIIEHFCTNRIINRDAAGMMQIAEKLILKSEGISTLLIFPLDEVYF